MNSWKASEKLNKAYLESKQDYWNCKLEDVEDVTDEMLNTIMLDVCQTKGDQP